MNKKILFYVALFAMVAVFMIAAAYVARPYLLNVYRPLVVQWLTASLSAAEKREIYQRIAHETPSLWDTTPEPLVGRVAKPDQHTVLTQAPVHTNNVGMRDKRNYTGPHPDAYRIVCLGDSFVFGEGGLEEDRFCSQLGQWFAGKNIKIEGKPVEMLAIGLPSWTMLQEASYMTSRLSAYDPDLIIVLTVSNDITVDSGVTGSGLLTTQFSASERQWGSGVIHLNAGAEFGFGSDYSALQYDDAPVATHYWTHSMSALKRLSELQLRRNKKILLSVLNEEGKNPTYFESVYREYLLKLGIDAPAIAVTYRKSTETMLPHDDHPNRAGHQLLRDQYIHAMFQQHWVDISETDLPPLAAELVPDFTRVTNNKLTRQRSVLLRAMPEALDFSVITSGSVRGVLGGILRDMAGDGKGLPWASVRAGLVLKLPADTPAALVLDIDIPDRAELFPMETRVTLQGEKVTSFMFDMAGKKTLRLPITQDLLQKQTLEVMIENNRHFTEVEDPRMKCFRLIRAEWSSAP